jgi:hypothetical protein
MPAGGAWTRETMRGISPAPCPFDEHSTKAYFLLVTGVNARRVAIREKNAEFIVFFAFLGVLLFLFLAQFD